VKFAVLGTGVVGETIGSALLSRGHEVTMGSRTAGNEKAIAWAAHTGSKGAAATFADAASAGGMVFNCTSGIHSLDALTSAGADALSGKVLVDVSNPLDFTGGFPPRLSVSGDDSLAEQIQRQFPETRVVKALNTVTAAVMVDPGSLSEATDLPIAGDDAEAKAQVTDLVAELGWQRERVLDLGGLQAARGMEKYLILWLSLMGATGGPQFNIRLVTADTSA
jgi:predicted dinucleotide-binding enzyme